MLTRTISPWERIALLAAPVGRWVGTAVGSRRRFQYFPHLCGTFKNFHSQFINSCVSAFSVARRARSTWCCSASSDCFSGDQYRDSFERSLRVYREPSQEIGRSPPNSPKQIGIARAESPESKPESVKYLVKPSVCCSLTSAVI